MAMPDSERFPILGPYIINIACCHTPTTTRKTKHSIKSIFLSFILQEYGPKLSYEKHPAPELPSRHLGRPTFVIPTSFLKGFLHQLDLDRG